MISQSDLNKAISAFASTISTGPLGLAKYRPESWGQQTRCFENVGRKVQQDRGRGQNGWMFQYKYLADDNRLDYLLAIHHAVWGSEERRGGEEGRSAWGPARDKS